MVNPGSSTTQQASSSSTEPHQASTSEMTVDEKLQFLAQAATVRDVEGPWRTDEGPPSIARRVLLDLQLEHEKEGSLLFLLLTYVLHAVGGWLRTALLAPLTLFTDTKATITVIFVLPIMFLSVFVLVAVAYSQHLFGTDFEAIKNWIEEVDSKPTRAPNNSKVATSSTAEHPSAEIADAERGIHRRMIAGQGWSTIKKFRDLVARYFDAAAGPAAPQARPQIHTHARGTRKRATKPSASWHNLCALARETSDSVKVTFSPLAFFADFSGSLVSFLLLPAVFNFLVCYRCYRMTSNYVEGFLNRYRKESDSGSLINLADPTLLSSKEALKTVISARATLSGLPTTLPEAPALVTSGGGEGEFRTTRIFDLDVAKSLLLMSTLVYEIRDADVKAAKSAEQIEDVGSRLEDSESFIRKQASDWGLRYLSMSGFVSDSKLGKETGPFASCFYTPPATTEEPFIVLCFKGTTPDNFDEFIVDASISRVSCASFFGDGTAHRGFMHELFSVDRNGYVEITRALRLLAREMVTLGWDSKPIPLWITGHSLGGALSTLIYARYLRCPADLGPDIVLRDGYTFGAPRVGDGTFASKFEESTCNPIDRPNILWRVVNSVDIVPRIPPGLADNPLNRPLGSLLSMLNYSHIGVQVKLCPDKEPYYTVDTTSLHSAARVLVVKAEQQGAARTPSWFPFFGGWGKESLKPEKWASWLFVRAVETATPIWNHFPASYYAHLSKMKVDDQGGAARSLVTQTGAEKKR